MRGQISCRPGSAGSIRQIVLTVGVLGVGAAVACACNVPVFRYALERWQPDPYRLVVLYRGPLGAEEQALLSPLRDQAEQGLINVAIRDVDADGALEPEDAALLAALDHPELPCVIVKYPQELQIETPIWTEPLSAAAVARLSDSPVRRELVRRLGEGATAVWLLLESGDVAKDDAAAALLQAELQRLEKSLMLPELTSAPEDSLLSSQPLEIAFSVLRVPRDPAEQALIMLLVQCEPDLAERADPLVFPVFGRGRALLPLVGAGITADNIRESATFLTGACSCQVKAENPGFDLLLSADWGALLSAGGVAPAVAAASEVNPPDQAELVPIPSGKPPKSAAIAVVTPRVSVPAATGVRGSLHYGWLIAGGISLVVLGAVLRLARAARDRP